jgi:outer membrane protein OmpA-like peptidoglycan-associated protein
MSGSMKLKAGLGTLALALALPVAAQNLMVDGYVGAAGGSVWKDSSGECWRTPYEDTSKLLGECGYEEVVEQDVEIQKGVGATDVRVMETAVVMKDGKVLASETAVVEQITVNNVEFAFDSAEMKGQYQAELDSVSAILEPHRPLLRQGLETLYVIGHTDSKGSEEYNMALSKRRAQAVADHLMTQDPSRGKFIKVVGRGESEPIASNDTEAGRQVNRRVVIEVVRN